MAHGILVWALAASFALLAACGGAQRSLSAQALPEPIAIAAPKTYSSRERPEELCRIDPGACASSSPIGLTGPLAGAPVVRKVRSGYGYVAEQSASSDSGSPPAPPPAIPVAQRTPRVEFFDIEARIQLEVSDVASGRGRLVALTQAFGGQVMNEAIEESVERRGASLSLRVPSVTVHAFVERLKELGKVRSTTLETREVGRSLQDAEVLQHNLEQALARYEELLAKAANVAEATALENELARVRTDLARVKSDLAWTRDRVARSTVYVTLAPASVSVVAGGRAKIYPGLRALFLLQVPPKSVSERPLTYLGAGLSFQWSRLFDVDLDLLNDLGRTRGTAVDFYALTLGSALYSEFLGGGRRRTLNPYFGFRGGYAHMKARGFGAFGGSVGVELYKTQRLLVALESRFYGLFGADGGPDFGFEPSLSVNLAY